MKKTHILLINPRIEEKSQNKHINAMVNITFPTSLGVLASYLMAHGTEHVEIVDEQIRPLDEARLTEAIRSLETPRIVGMSVLTLNSGRAYTLADRIKMIDPDATVVLGGIHPTVATNETLLKNGVDVVVRGEGEETFEEMVRKILAGEDFFDIPGISYRKNGELIHNPGRSLLEDLDQIPPFPYHLFEKDLEKYPNFSGIFGSRGCPYNCTFCSSRSISGKRYRYHSVERIISEIKTLVRTYGQNSIFLMDDNISVNRKHFKALCEAIIHEGLDREAFFHGSMRGDNASDEILELAQAANFRIIYFGLETGSERLMKIVDKGETVAQVVDAIQRAAAHGFSVGTTIIFGLPTETRKDRYQTKRLVQSLPLSSVRYNTLAPYPGTPVFRNEFPKGNVLVKGHWENFGVQYMWESDDIPYVPENDERIFLIFDTMWANYCFYLSPRGIRRMLTERYAGGNVIKLGERWYLSATFIKKMTLLFSYLFFRFSDITVRMLWKTVVKRYQ